MKKTDEQFDSVTQNCREIFVKKMQDYGTAWRILRLSSLTDQIFIKANRIRNLEIKKTQQIADSIRSEYIGIINYAVISLIQLELGLPKGDTFSLDVSEDETIKLYEKYIGEAKNLMQRKNHDYGEAWRSMRISSYTDLILMKLYRIKQIEDNKGKTITSEGIDANYFDIINYAIFALIKIDFAQETV